MGFHNQNVNPLKHDYCLFIVCIQEKHGFIPPADHFANTTVMAGHPELLTT